MSLDTLTQVHGQAEEDAYFAVGYDLGASALVLVIPHVKTNER